MTTKMRRAPNPTWLKEGELERLLAFANRYGGVLKIHNHPKTVRRW